MQPLQINEDLVLDQRSGRRKSITTRAWNYSKGIYKNTFGDAWGLEYASYLCSLLFMVAVIAILAYYDGKPHIGQSSHVTINTLVAMGFAISKGLMIACVSACIGQFKYLTGHQKNSRLIDVEIYNSASQDIFGAIRLLFKPKAMRMSLFGACIIISALAVDMFVQQLVSYPIRATLVPESKATLNISIEWTEVSHQNYSSGLPTNNILKRELEARRSSLRPAPDAGYSCPTGNCEWPEFLTIGVCSECSDITSSLKSKVEVGFHDTSSWNFANNSSYNKSWPRQYNSVLPNGLILKLNGSLEDDLKVWNASTVERISGDRNNSADPLLLEFSLIYLRQDSQVWSNSTLYGSPRDGKLFDSLNQPAAQTSIDDKVWSFSSHNKETIVNGSWEAYNCGISLCIQYRKAQFRNSHFQDEILSQDIVPLDCGYFDDWLKKPSWCTMKYQNLRLDPKLKGFVEHVEFPDEDQSFFVPKGKSDPTSDKLVWKKLVSDDGRRHPKNSLLVLENRVPAWRKFLSELFHVSFEHINYTPLYLPGTPEMRYHLWDPFGDDPIAQYVENLSKYATTAIRNDEGNPTFLRGSAFKYETYVQVEWPWLTLPIILQCATLILLVSTVNETKRMKVKPWKSSVLPLLTDGLDFTEARDYALDISELERRASYTPLILHRFWRVISRKGTGKTQEGAIKL